MNSRTAAHILSFAGAFTLAACGGSNSSEDGEILTSAIDGTSVSVAMSDDGGETLGSVKLSRPSWLPEDFPLPKDARIYAVVAQEKQTPPIYMIQARTMSGGEEVVKSFIDWANRRGLQAERNNSPNVQIHIASIDQGNDSRAELQVHQQENGVNNIMLAANGRPWR